MSFRGRKVADIYAELHIDRDTAKSALRGLPGQLGPDADRAGQELGRKVTDGLAKAVEQSSARLSRARRAEQSITDAVRLAEVRLDEVRKKAQPGSSQLLAAEQKLEQARRKQVDATDAIGSIERRLAKDRDALAAGLRKTAAAAGPDAERAGQDLGGKLSQGIQLSIIRNSPLIAAGIGAALAAGAPVALAGATGLFAGIGIAAQAQSVRVQSAWSQTWNGIKEDAFDVSSSIQPVLVGLAGQVGDAFERVGPQLRRGFEAAAPQLQVFADGILGLTENALPGLVRAVERGMPVTQGLAAFLEKTGRGLTGFFDAMSSQAPAAGAAFAALGDIMAGLLPTLGEVLGQGAKLASIVLPPLARAVGVVAAAADALGPLLPGLALGFAAMKIAQSATGWISGFADKMRALPGQITAVSASTAAAGLALGAIALGYKEATSLGQSWAAALQKGGTAADEAAAKMSNFGLAMEAVQGDSWIAAFGGLATTIGMTTVATDEAKKAQQEYLDSLSPTAAAARDLQIAEDELSRAIQENGAGSREAKNAQRDYEAATRDNELAQGNLEMALDGVTSAMIEQADQALAAIDSSFAYRNAVNELEDKQTALNDAIHEFGPDSEEAQRAQLALEEQNFATATSFAQQQADLSGLKQGTAEYNRLIQQETLAELYRLRDAAGPQMRGAIDQQIQALRNAGVTLDGVGADARGAAGELDALGRRRPTPVASLVDYSSARAQAIIDRLNAIRSKTVTVTTIEQRIINTINNTVAFRQLGGATGGQVGALQPKTIKRSAGGPIEGEGGPTDDRVRMLTTRGEDLYVSPGEWIIREMSSRRYGDTKMSAVNAGRADIVLPGDPRYRGGLRRADGGPVRRAEPAGRAPAQAGLTVNGGVTVNVTFPAGGSFDIRDRSQARRFVDWIEQELIRRTRATS